MQFSFKRPSALPLMVFLWLLCGSVMVPLSADASSRNWDPQGSGGAWVNYISDNLGDAAGCAPGETKTDFVFRDYDTKRIITNTNDLEASTYIYNAGNSSLSQLYTAGESAVSPAVCYDPRVASAWPKLRQTGDEAVYYTVEPVGFGRWSGVEALQGRYLRGTVYVRRLANGPVVVANNLHNSITRNNEPTFSFTVASAWNMANSTAGRNTALWVWRQDNYDDRSWTDWQRDTAGTGQRNVAYWRDTPLRDGVWGWMFSHQRNGTEAIVTNDRGNYLRCDGDGVMVEIALWDDAGRRATMTGMTGSLLVKAGDTVRSTHAFGTSAVSPMVCLQPDTERLEINLRAGSSAVYFNGSNDEIGAVEQVVENSDGQQYFRGNLTLPTRTRTIGSEVVVRNTPELSFQVIESRTELNFNNGSKPQSGLWRPTYFMVDTTAPTANLTATADVSRGVATVQFRNIVRDTTAGVRRATLYVRRAAVSEWATTVTHFEVGDGIVGGPKDAQRIMVPIVAIPGATYVYYTTVVDAAGNTFTSEEARITVPDLPDEPAATGVITTTNCRIAVGAADCTVAVSWTITNATESIVRTWAGTVVANTARGTGQAVRVAHGTTTFEAVGDGVVLDTAMSRAECVDGARWSREGGRCIDIAATATLSATDCTIALGARTCESRVSWLISEAADPLVFNVTRSQGVASRARGELVSHTLVYGDNRLEARDGTTVLRTVTPRADCDPAEAEWSVSRGQCVALPTTATLTTEDCEIALGAARCDAPMEWSIRNATEPNLYNQTRDVIYRATARGNNAYAVDHGENIIEARDGTTVLQTRTVVATCVGTAEWSVSRNRCVTAGTEEEEGEIILTPDRTVVRIGETVQLTWDINHITDLSSCSLQGPGVSRPNISTTEGAVESGPITARSIFRLTCGLVEGSAVVDVVPLYQEV